MVEHVKVWLKKDIEGTYFVSGKYFYNNKIGDIPASKKYSAKERYLSDVLEKSNNNSTLNKMQGWIRQICRETGFIADIEVEPE